MAKFISGVATMIFIVAVVLIMVANRTASSGQPQQNRFVPATSSATDTAESHIAQPHDDGNGIAVDPDEIPANSSGKTDDAKNPKTEESGDNRSLSEVMSKPVIETEFMKAQENSPNVLFSLTSTGDMVFSNSFGTCSIVKMGSDQSKTVQAFRDCEKAYQNHP